MVTAAPKQDFLCDGSVSENVKKIPYVVPQRSPDMGVLRREDDFHWGVHRILSVSITTRP